MAKSKGRGGKTGGSGGSAGRANRAVAKTAARKIDDQAKPAKAGGKAATPDKAASDGKPVSRDTVGRRASDKPGGQSADNGARSSTSGTSRPRPAPTKRTTPPASARYTPPVPKSQKVSPIWVPILMFTCLGLGMLMIILNYVNVLPGPEPSNGYLMGGLALITVGFITATKYH